MDAESLVRKGADENQPPESTTKKRRMENREDGKGNVSRQEGAEEKSAHAPTTGTTARMSSSTANRRSATETRPVEEGETPSIAVRQRFPHLVYLPVATSWAAAARTTRTGGTSRYLPPFTGSDAPSLIAQGGGFADPAAVAAATTLVVPVPLFNSYPNKDVCRAAELASVNARRPLCFRGGVGCSSDASLSLDDSPVAVHVVDELTEVGARGSSRGQTAATAAGSACPQPVSEDGSKANAGRLCPPESTERRRRGEALFQTGGAVWNEWASTAHSTTPTSTTITTSSTSFGSHGMRRSGASASGDVRGRRSGAPRGCDVTVDFCSRECDGSGRTPLHRTALGCFSLTFASMLCRDADTFTEMDEQIGSTWWLRVCADRDALDGQRRPQPPPRHPGGTVPGFHQASSFGKHTTHASPLSPVLGDGFHPDGGSGGGLPSAPALARRPIVPLLTALFYALQALELCMESARKGHLAALRQEAEERRQEQRDESRVQELDSILGAHRRRGKNDKEGEEEPRHDSSNREVSPDGEAVAVPDEEPLDALRGAVVADHVYRAVAREEEKHRGRAATGDTAPAMAAVGDDATVGDLRSGETHHLRSRRLREKALREQRARQRAEGEAATPPLVSEARQRVHAMWLDLLQNFPDVMLDHGYVEWWLRHERHRRYVNADRNADKRKAETSGGDEGKADPTAIPTDEPHEAGQALKRLLGLEMQEELNRELYGHLVEILRVVATAPDACAGPTFSAAVDEGGQPRGTFAMTQGYEGTLVGAERFFGAAGLASGRPTSGGAGVWLVPGEQGGSRDRAPFLAFTPCASLANTPQRPRARQSRYSSAAELPMVGGVTSRQDLSRLWDTPGKGRGSSDTNAPGAQMSSASSLATMELAEAAGHCVAPGLSLALSALHLLTSLHTHPTPALRDLVQDRGTPAYELLLVLCELLNGIPLHVLLLAATEGASSCTLLCPRSQALLQLTAQGMTLAASAAARLTGLRLALRPQLTSYMSRLSQMRATLTECAEQEPDDVVGKAPASFNGSSTCVVGFGKSAEQFDREYACLTALLPFAC